MVGLLLPDACDAASGTSTDLMVASAARAGLRELLILAAPDRAAEAIHALRGAAMSGIRSAAVVPGPSAGTIERLLSARPFLRAELCCVVVGGAATEMIESAITAFFRTAIGRPGMTVLSEVVTDAPEPEVSRRVPGSVLVCDRGTVELADFVAAPRPGPIRFAHFVEALDRLGRISRIEAPEAIAAPPMLKLAA